MVKRGFASGAVIAVISATAPVVASSDTSSSAGGEVLPLAGMAVPGTVQVAPPDNSGRTVLAPSCLLREPGACTRLREICDRLAGSMELNADGSQTCVILLD